MTTYPPFSKRDSAQVIDFAVIGAGVFGLSAAFHIKNEYPSMMVYVIEADEIAKSTPLATLCHSTTAFIPNTTSSDAQTMQERAFNSVKEEENLDCEFRDTNAWLCSKSNQPTEVYNKFFSCIDDDKSTNKTEIDSKYYDNALSVPCASINQEKFLKELAKSFVKCGGEIRENSRVTKIKDTCPIIFRVNGVEAVAKVIILATGSQSHKLKFFNNRILPGFTSSIVSKPLSSQSIHSVIIENDIFPPFCIIPKDDRVIISGGLQFPSKDDETCKADTDTLLEKFLKRFPQHAQIQVESSLSEAISVTIDNGPLFGRIDVGDSAIFYGFSNDFSMKFLFGQLVKEYMEEGEDMSWHLKYALIFHDAPWAGFPLIRPAIRKIRANARSKNAMRVFVLAVVALVLLVLIEFWK